MSKLPSHKKVHTARRTLPSRGEDKVGDQERDRLVAAHTVRSGIACADKVPTGEYHEGGRRDDMPGGKLHGAEVGPGATSTRSSGADYAVYSGSS